MTGGAERGADWQRRTGRDARRVTVAYAAVGLALVVIIGLLISMAVSGAAVEAVWVAGATALAVQVTAFAALVVLGQRGGIGGFLLAWAGGTMLRFGAVLLGGLWLIRVAGYPPLVLLLSMIGFVFVLLMLEPVFFRMGVTASR